MRPLPAGAQCPGTPGKCPVPAPILAGCGDLACPCTSLPASVRQDRWPGGADGRELQEAYGLARRAGDPTAATFRPVELSAGSEAPWRPTECGILAQPAGFPEEAAFQEQVRRCAVALRETRPQGSVSNCSHLVCQAPGVHAARGRVLTWIQAPHGEAGMALGDPSREMPGGLGRGGEPMPQPFRPILFQPFREHLVRVEPSCGLEASDTV